MPKAKKSVMIIDGENLVFRYQDMLSDGFSPYDDIKHRKDIYVWSSRLLPNPEEEFEDVSRITYYTSATGDDKKLFTIMEEISNIEYTTTIDAMGGVSSSGRVVYFQNKGHVIPKVFKKRRSSAKSHRVDIAITIDALNYCLIDSIDCLTIITGDGDFIPLIEECMHKGKNVNIMALSKGLNNSLKVSADGFKCIDYLFFERATGE